MKYGVKVPYPMAPCFDQLKRHRYMLTCLEHKFPKLIPSQIDQGKSLSLVGFGPSLHDTWQDIKPPIMTMSGAHDFLIKRGIVPDYHCDMDPRPHKVAMLNPHPDVVYLMASVCNPAMWIKVKGHKVLTWHAVSGDLTHSFLLKKDPGTLMVSGGSCIGLVSIHLGGVIGFNHFEIHAFDGSFKDGKRHAGKHWGYPHEEIDKEINGRVFKVSKIMENSNVEMEKLLQSFPVFTVFHGDGRMQWWLKQAGLNNATTADSENVESIRNGKVVEITHKEAQEKGLIQAA